MPWNMPWTLSFWVHVHGRRFGPGEVRACPGGVDGMIFASGRDLVRPKAATANPLVRRSRIRCR